MSVSSAENPTAPASDTDAVGDFAERPARERLRIIKDRLFAATMAIGGVAVIIAILLIFLYLFYVVLPLFAAAEISAEGPVPAVGVKQERYLAIDEYAEIGLAVGDDGHYRFFNLHDGREVLSGQIGTVGTALFSAGDPDSRSLFSATPAGQVVVARAEYAISYPDDQRAISPGISFPLGEQPLTLGPATDTLRLLAGQSTDEETTIVGVFGDSRLELLHIMAEESFLGDEPTLEQTRSTLELNGARVTHIALDIDQRELFVVTDDGDLSLFNVTNKAEPVLVDRARALTENGSVTTLEILSGGISILVGDTNGHVTQWFPVRDQNNNYSLARVRQFKALSAPITHIAPEHYRKAFAAIDANGQLALYHTTADRRVLMVPTGYSDARALALSPRADRALVVSAEGEVARYHIENEHPEVSMSALWGEVWYESRESPEYIWQSSSASSDFEPKFSLTPLTFGTFKATFYSMLFAIPIAVFGAIYTAYFMTPAMRNIVKPSIEVMAALPTVILGFLAGLWLAPLIERELLGIFLTVALVPGAILIAALVWSRLPQHWRSAVPDGWEAVLLIPVLILATWGSLELGSLGEILFFGGSLPHWLNVEYGISYDQRNSLVVGIAIGFAVIPTIFSISEDAVFSVPRSLTMGSLALGATPWQTAVRVVLLTASPGIFSAVMIGMGRAVGETMIVLMATGNTPIMDINIFQGFRALSANIAVEMPESEVNSTHYRVLFLAALVLFLVTFMVNTVAELVRQRLRNKYASL